MTTSLSLPEHIAFGYETDAIDLAGLTDQDAMQRHPLLRRHPITGEIALYLSTLERCSELSGYTPAQSQETIEALYEQARLNVVSIVASDAPRCRHPGWPREAASRRP
ncbi:hypothetical protein [Salinisphaera japonica]|uniref:Uncharacterized protein n=1 Tax=Salinisphaera japonica YTM-1 TaxID=1209778 RepID=A0A423PTA7_9GAMM|nr:hypothetical protein [Salinisphaera japonica]ROO28798.1 hypothetical protein SAJA_07275 [Salinisphaera japonica YTM-1]